MPLETARHYLIENQGRQFDPACVDAFLSRWSEVVEIAAGQRATPFQTAEAAPVADIERAAESDPAEAVPAA
jgi:putative two-component system response regulator